MMALGAGGVPKGISLRKAGIEKACGRGRINYCTQMATLAWRAPTAITDEKESGDSFTKMAN
jgi:hypothetical protein